MHWILTEWSQVPPQPHVVTIGNFDGVHRGHQYLLEAVKARARDLHAHSLVITFDPLPPEVLAPDRAPRRLTLTEHRVRLIRQCGIERVLLVRFDLAFASLSAEDFIERLATATHPVEIVVGDDFHFGRNRSGNPTLLRHQAPRYGFQVSVVCGVGQESTTISSTAIRRAIAAGDVRTAWELLGRPHALIGSVIPGAGRGSQLGFPTANLAVFDRL
ncbi:MAG: adenylyltransferase/cytidyltransferase family protein, partial [Thermomicrobium sp.]|nr:adenylyltransferase/cytidyltransferase family protein [Thermomicrobium sp.]